MRRNKQYANVNNGTILVLVFRHVNINIDINYKENIK